MGEKCTKDVTCLGGWKGSSDNTSPSPWFGKGIALMMSPGMFLRYKVLSLHILSPASSLHHCQSEDGTSVAVNTPRTHRHTCSYTPCLYPVLFCLFWGQKSQRITCPTEWGRPDCNPHVLRHCPDHVLTRKRRIPKTHNFQVSRRAAKAQRGQVTVSKTHRTQQISHTLFSVALDTTLLP